MEGIINVLKPPGMTSHDVVSFLRRTLGVRRIGHSGTLDPQAAGVLPVCVGNGTRLAEYLSRGTKAYLCEMTLGKRTDTQDAWGTILDEQPIPRLNVSQIKKVATEFEGEINQQVPAYSAVKVAGQPLYKAARRGEEIEAIYRKVTIHQLNILGYQGDTIRFWVECSQGTYVRALCQDFGEALGTAGYMSFLLRTAVASFTLDSTVTLEKITELKEKVLLPIEVGVDMLPKIQLNDEQTKRILHGQVLKLTSSSLGWGTLEDVACFDVSNRLVAISRWVPGTFEPCNHGTLKPRKVFK